MDGYVKLMQKHLKQLLTVSSTTHMLNSTVGQQIDCKDAMELFVLSQIIHLYMILLLMACVSSLHRNSHKSIMLILEGMPVRVKVVMSLILWLELVLPSLCDIV